MRYYRFFSLTLAIIFGAVGLMFLTLPEVVLKFFNSISEPTGLPAAPITGFNFYLVLSVAYMYIVAIIAFMMYRHPADKYFPLLLMNAKFASSLLSLLLFFLVASCLIYLANSLVDGAIAGFVFYMKSKRVPA